MLFASVEKIEDGDQKWHGIGGLYLHGKVEDFFGYDIVAVAKDDLEELKNAPAKMAEVSEKLRQAAEKGPEELENAKKENPDFIECQVDGYHGKTLLFVWKANQDIFPEEFYRGLIVDAEDEEAVEDARTRFNEKAFTI
jgi:hypothetical protein